MAKLMFAALAVWILIPVAFAQNIPTADVTVGYAHLYILKGYTIWMNGGRGTVSFNANNWFAVAGDFGAYVGHIPQSFTGATYLVGPRFSYRKLPWTVPFVQALVGGSHFSTSTGGITGGGSEFAFAVGGGGDIGLGTTRNFGLRLEGDYVGIRSSGSITPAVRLSIGIVYRFGNR
jgi:hypothetical protein